MKYVLGRITHISPFDHACESCGFIASSEVTKHRIQGGDVGEVLYVERCDYCGTDVFDAPPTYHTTRAARWIPRHNPKPAMRNAA